MVDIDILIQIWKNRVKKIDFVLKWLSRVGSEVGPTKGEKSLENRGRRLGRPRDFGDLPKRRDEGRVVNTPLVFKMILFQEKGEETEKEKAMSWGEREKNPPCMEKRAESGDWSGKTMNAGGVENRID
ncbi:hypothetical protein TNCV_3737861 [Trichonephila clavipes]|nr:hypothetical protein TNCV_3737861 [Trichonephila clavipes]